MSVSIQYTIELIAYIGILNTQVSEIKVIHQYEVFCVFGIHLAPTVDRALFIEDSPVVFDIYISVAEVIGLSFVSGIIGKSDAVQRIR